MLLTIAKSGEQVKEDSEEWLVDTDPGHTDRRKDRLILVYPRIHSFCRGVTRTSFKVRPYMCVAVCFNPFLKDKF